MAIRDLASHRAPFVTVDELAKYWGVSRRQVHNQIKAGRLEAVVLGPRLYRIRAAAALKLEQMLKTEQLHPASPRPPRIQ